MGGTNDPNINLGPPPGPRGIKVRDGFEGPIRFKGWSVEPCFFPLKSLNLLLTFESSCDFVGAIQE